MFQTITEEQKLVKKIWHSEKRTEDPLEENINPTLQPTAAHGVMEFGWKTEEAENYIF